MPSDTNPKHAEVLRDIGGPEDPTLREARKNARRSDTGEAFLPDAVADGVHGRLPSDDAEWFAEEFIATATGGESLSESARDEVVDEEEGGPFLELAYDDLPDTLPDLPATIAASKSESNAASTSDEAVTGERPTLERGGKAGGAYRGRLLGRRSAQGGQR